jgi:endonuclease YncB( thermonuclease family)
MITEAVQPHGTASFLRRRRLARWISSSSIVLVVITAGWSHWAGRAIDDRAAFNHRKLLVTNIIAGDEVVVRRESGSPEQTIHLIGVVAPRGDEHWAEESRQRMASWLLNKTVVLFLESPQTRDADGKLLAYVYTTDSINVNAEAVREGLAYAERREAPLLGPFIQQAENEARKKSHGLWKDVKFTDQPAWRQAWLAAHRKHS